MPDSPRNPWKGLLAGAVGGLAGAFAMGEFHSFLERARMVPQQQGEEDSTIKAASAVAHHLFHHELTALEKKLAAPGVHYAFGASMAALYGALVEYVPSLRAGYGLPFGLAVWLGAHVITVPTLGLSEPITRSPIASEAGEFGAHLLYGAVAENLGRFIRAGL